MAEREHEKPGDSPAEEETAAETEAEAEDTEAEAEDLEIADEEITERVRGGARAISIPY